MKKTTILFLLTGLILSQYVLAQSIVDVMNDEKINYYEKVELIEQSLVNQKANVDDPILKRYYRWRSFWDTRVGTDGAIEAYANAWHDIFNNKSFLFASCR